MSTEAAPDEDWLTPGAAVVVFRNERAARFWARPSTVATVGKKTFTVTGEQHGERPMRFDNTTRTHRGGTWDAPTCVVPAGSDEAHAALDRVRVELAQSRVESAYHAWTKARTADSLARLAHQIDRLRTE